MIIYFLLFTAFTILLLSTIVEIMPTIAVVLIVPLLGIYVLAVTSLIYKEYYMLKTNAKSLADIRDETINKLKRKIQHLNQEISYYNSIFKTFEYAYSNYTHSTKINVPK